MAEEGRFTIHLEHQEDYQIVREGIPIKVSVEDKDGLVLHSSD